MLLPRPEVPGLRPADGVALDDGRRSADQWRGIVSRYDWPIDEALRVILGPTPPNAQAPDGCPTGESGGNAAAYNNGNYGGMQINAASHLNKLYDVTGGYDVTRLFEPEVNVAVGYLVWLRSGGRTFLPWSCRP